MAETAEAQLHRGLQASEDGRYAEAYDILRPLAVVGNVQAQACLGGLIFLGLHRFQDLAAFNDWNETFETATPDQIAAHSDEVKAGWKVAEPWLRAASDAGDWAATNNLAMMSMTGIGEEGWEERKLEVLRLLGKLSKQQGCSIYDGDPPGESYVAFMERCATLHKRYADRHPEHS